LIAKEFLDDELVIAQLTEQYGDDILDASGALDRKRLAAAAFVGPESIEGLNQTIWPLVKERLADLLLGQSCTQTSENSLTVVEVALLAEASDFCDLADYIIAISAPTALRIERALARGMDRADIENRMALQATDTERAAICDLVIVNDSNLEALYAQLDYWYDSFVNGRLL
jgi:dephospho-CoA kinase